MMLALVLKVASVASDQTAGGAKLVVDHKFMRPTAQLGQLALTWPGGVNETVSQGEATATAVVFVADVRPSVTTRMAV
jgi:hypothetical protein